MAKAREIKKRMKAVGNIRRITKTMQMIATSKFARSQQAAMASKPYTEGIFELVTELAARAGNISHPLIDGPTSGFKPGAKEVILVITSNRGLCGPYNGSILRAAIKYVRQKGRDAFYREVVGKKGAAALKFAGIPLDANHTHFGDAPKIEDVVRLAESYMDRFQKGEITGVSIVSMRFISTSRQRVETLQLLPLKPPTVAAVAGDDSKSTTDQYEFSPDAATLLAELLPETVTSTMWQCFSDAIVSEHVARMVAMKAATDNSVKMGRSLSRRYNRARQTQITTELTEIISGAAALE